MLRHPSYSSHISFDLSTISGLIIAYICLPGWLLLRPIIIIFLKKPSILLKTKNVDKFYQLEEQLTPRLFFHRLLYDNAKIRFKYEFDNLYTKVSNILNMQFSSDSDRGNFISSRHLVDNANIRG